MQVVGLYCSTSARLVHNVDKPLSLYSLAAGVLHVHGATSTPPEAWRDALPIKHTKQHVRLSSRFWERCSTIKTSSAPSLSVALLLCPPLYSAWHGHHILILLGCPVEPFASRSLPRTHHTYTQPDASSKVRKRWPPYNYYLQR
jgi:hypothetical protein